MSRLHKAPFAVTDDGTVLLNVRELDGVETVEDGLFIAGRQRAPIFIGVPVTKAELGLLLERVGHGHREAAGRLVGRRRFREQQRQK